MIRRTFRLPPHEREEGDEREREKRREGGRKKWREGEGEEGERE